MTVYYKATRPNGRDFYTGTVDYGAALTSGAVIRHRAAKRVKGAAATYLSVATVPTDCTGFSWPCRLFTVEGVGRGSRDSDWPNKRCFSALRVTGELPAWQVFGPQGEQVVAMIDRAGRLTGDEVERLAAAWLGRPRHAAWGAAWHAARNASRDAARGAAWHAAWGASWQATRHAARNAAWNAATALVVRDLITPDQFDLLYGPWRQVIGE